VTGIATTNPTKGKGSAARAVTRAPLSFLQQASTDYSNAQTALANGNLGQYQRDVNAMNQQLKLAQTALNKG